MEVIERKTEKRKKEKKKKKQNKTKKIWPNWVKIESLILYSIKIYFQSDLNLFCNSMMPRLTVVAIGNLLPRLVPNPILTLTSTKKKYYLRLAPIYTKSFLSKLER